MPSPNDATRPVDPVEPVDPVDRARSHGRTARAALDPRDREAATRSVVTRLSELAELGGREPGSVPGRVAISVAVRGELDVTGVAAVVRDRGVEVWLPAVVGDSLVFREWRDGDRLVPGRFGIPEPPDDGRDTLDATGLDVVVIPCVAVDERGTRVGSGFGYYDRALADGSDAGPTRPRRPVVVAAAFEVQVVGELPMRAWDVPADVVVTERRTILTHRR